MSKSGSPPHVRLRDAGISSHEVPPSGVPDEIDAALREHEFDTPAQRDAARAILQHWEDAMGNRSTIADRSDWSPPHIRQTFDKYFEADDSEVDQTHPTSWDDVTDLPEWARSLYREAYRDGYRDGFEDGANQD